MGRTPQRESFVPNGASRHTGALIINADDWGHNRENTDRTLECCRVGAVSAVSAMVFMEDSERAASIAREADIDVGLHLNFTSPFSKTGNTTLVDRQLRIAKYLHGHRLAPVVFHPGLIRSFDYVVSAQLDEFRRIYGHEPARIDGHHHMHLCANVLVAHLLPNGTIVRRNFSFVRGERSIANRSWRKVVDSLLARRHRLTDFFFSLPPLGPDRLEGILVLASKSIVEMETHPVNPEEYAFLTSGIISRWGNKVEVNSFSRCFG